MTRQSILIIAGAFSIAAATALVQNAMAQSAGEDADQPTEQLEPAAETPEQIAARELCTETAAPGAHPGWTVRERLTCENSFAEICRIIRDGDGAEASHTCYEPLPMYDPDAEAEAGGEQN